MGRGRPRLELGTWGEVKATEQPSGQWKARCWYRDINGVYSRPARTGKTEAAAKRALVKHLATRPTRQTSVITRHTLYAKAAESWFEKVIEAKVSIGKLADGTARTYRSILDGHVLPALGKLELWEADAGRHDELYIAIQRDVSWSTAKTVRSITSGIGSYVVRCGALDHNPTKAASALVQGDDEGKLTEALTEEQLRALFTKLSAYVTAKAEDKTNRLGKRVMVWTDLPDLTETMLATGVRIGEVLAITPEKISRDDQGRLAVLIDGHVVRERGKGLVRKPGRKNLRGRRNKATLLLLLPDSAAPMLLRRKLATAPGAPIFCARDGGWLDPSNSIGRFRTALDECGFEWVTPHVWRKTVASFLDEAGLTDGEIADQLGNSRAIAERHYIKPRPKNQRAAAALNIQFRD